MAAVSFLAGFMRFIVLEGLNQRNRRTGDIVLTPQWCRAVRCRCSWKVHFGRKTGSLKNSQKDG